MYLYWPSFHQTFWMMSNMICTNWLLWKVGIKQVWLLFIWLCSSWWHGTVGNKDTCRHSDDQVLVLYIYIYIYICWFNFDALAQGNAYKPTKEPINYRGPGGDRTHDLQTEATPPAASCPARTLHATEIAPKKKIYIYIYIYIYGLTYDWTFSQLMERII